MTNTLLQWSQPAPLRLGGIYTPWTYCQMDSNDTDLGGIAVRLAVESIRPLIDPPPVAGGLVLATALVDVASTSARPGR